MKVKEFIKNFYVLYIFNSCLNLLYSSIFEGDLPPVSNLGTCAIVND